jgi:hypothetical protein
MIMRLKPTLQEIDSGHVEYGFQCDQSDEMESLPRFTAGSTRETAASPRALSRTWEKARRSLKNQTEIGGWIWRVCKEAEAAENSTFF